MMESKSQKFQRYCQSELCEVSDPETWMSIHHGTSDDKAENDESEDCMDDS